MIFQTSLGIDIGEQELCLAFLKASSREIELAAAAVYPIQENIHSEEKSTAISELVNKFLRENRLSPASVFLGIPRRNVILRYLELPITVKENLRETLGYELEKYVPFSSEEAYFDFQIVSEDKSADRLQLLLVVTKKEALSPILAFAEHSGLGISGVGITATALADYFYCRGKKDIGAVRAFIYKRGQHIELGLVKKGMLRYSRGLSGNEEFTEAIPAALSKMRLDFLHDKEPLHTVLCGIEKDDPLLERFNGMEEVVFHHVDLSEAQIPSPDFISVTPAFGLALKGVRKTFMNINLMPLSKRKKPSKFKYYTMFGLVFLVLLTAFAWGGGVFFQRQWALDRLDGEIKKLEVELKKFERLETEKESIESRIDYLNTLRKGGPPVLDMLRELSERIPEDAWVNRFAFTKKGIELSGEAVSASELIPLLEASPMFSDVAFLSAIRKRGSKDVFRIGLSINNGKNR